MECLMTSDRFNKSSFLQKSPLLTGSLSQGLQGFGFLEVAFTQDHISVCYLWRPVFSLDS